MDDARTVHSLKVWPEQYADIEAGLKTFEVRRNDRGFKVGHWLHLHEWNPATEEFSGRSLFRLVTYMTQGQFGLRHDMCVMGIADDGGR